MMSEKASMYQLIDDIQRLRTYPTKDELELINDVITEIDDFIDEVESALGCTDGDDIRAHLEPLIKQIKGER